MTFLGGLLVLSASYPIGRDAGLYGFFLSWFLIGAGVMGGGIVGIFASLPALACKKERALERLADEEFIPESVLKRYMGRWGWSGALAGGLLGALLAIVVV